MHSSGRREFSCHVLVVVNYWPSLLRSGAGAACTFPHGGSDRQDKINSIKDPTSSPPNNPLPLPSPSLSVTRIPAAELVLFGATRVCMPRCTGIIYSIDAQRATATIQPRGEVKLGPCTQLSNTGS